MLKACVRVQVHTHAHTQQEGRKKKNKRLVDIRDECVLVHIRVCACAHVCLSVCLGG